MYTPAHPVKVVAIDLAEPITDIEGLERYAGVQVLLRINGSPVGYVFPAIVNGRVQRHDLIEEVVARHADAIQKQLLRNGLAGGTLVEKDVRALFSVQPLKSDAYPLVSVAVCTRNRMKDLERCLEALCRLDYPHLDLLVIDNAPSSPATEDLVRSRFPNVRYIPEERPGLDWARNRAVIEARGEIIAYTDDDVVVDPLWVKALSQAFTECPEAGVVTGLIAPLELETRAQILFEMYGGFGRGFRRKEFNNGRRTKLPWGWLGTGQFGTGANMAYRRSVFEHVGLFDPALDVGTVTNGGGDLEMFCRVLKGGYTLVYEPNALVFHRHRREYSELRKQLTNNGIGLYAYFCRTAGAYPEEIPNILTLGFWWLYYWHLKRLCRSLVCGWRFPRELILREFWGCFVGLGRYARARQMADKVVKQFGPAPEWTTTTPAEKRRATPASSGIAIRSVDLSGRIDDMSGIKEYSQVQVFLFWRTRPLGHVILDNPTGFIARRRLIDAAIDQLGIRLFDPEWCLEDASLWADVITSLRCYLTGRHMPADKRQRPLLPASVKVSIIVGTYDRPDDLCVCLEHLTSQVTSRAIEIIVADNHPSSGLTAPVVRSFPGVRLLEESRQGSSYARNAAVLAATGDIIITTDDDVRAPENWVENLVAPFANPEVMAVTGNVLPLELETPSQRHFETYGGLGRGYRPRRFTRWWFDFYRRHAVPTWHLGATANAAFRSAVFFDPRIGLMDEMLGAGMPSGVGEDTYLFYRILKCGYTIEYQPAAWVWHRHRSDMAALKRQIYSYSKGHVCYHLVIAIRDGDLRGLLQIGYHLPRFHLQRLWDKLRGKGNYPLPLILLEIWGSLVGPIALFQSARIVRRQGRSRPRAYPKRMCYSMGCEAKISGESRMNFGCA